MSPLVVSAPGPAQGVVQSIESRIGPRLLHMDGGPLAQRRGRV